MIIQLHEPKGIREIETDDYTVQQLKDMGLEEMVNEQKIQAKMRQIAIDALKAEGEL